MRRRIQIFALAAVLAWAAPLPLLAAGDVPVPNRCTPQVNAKLSEVGRCP
jgi:hypothetical protein